MNAKDTAKHIFLYSCVFYTAATFLVLFLYFLLNKNLSAGMNVGALVMIYPFSLAFSAANFIYRHTKMSGGLRFTFHFLLTVSGLFFFLYLPNRNPEVRASSSFIMLLVFAILYLLIMGSILLVKHRIKSVTKSEEHYHGVYKK